MWDEGDSRFEAVKMIVDAGAGLDECYDDWDLDSKWNPEEDLTYTPIISPENIPLIGENDYSGIYAFRIAGYIVRNYAANHLMSCIRSAGKNRKDCNLEAVKFLVEAGADVNKSRT